MNSNLRQFTFWFSVLLSAMQAAAAEKTLDFRDSRFRSTVSGAGQPGDWKVITDGERSVLAQLSRDRTDEHAPLYIYDGESFGDFKITTRFKLVDGEVEQMAGIAFRLQDENNYYYIRASGLGNTFNFFKIVEGQRGRPIGAKVQIPKGVWHEMSIECKGSEIRASLNGKELIPPLGDHSFAAGKIAFWTKSDSVSYFADVRIISTPRERLAQSGMPSSNIPASKACKSSLSLRAPPSRAWLPDTRPTKWGKPRRRKCAMC
jgi:hypothetical protein